MNPFDEAPARVIDTGNGWMAVDKPAGWSVHNHPGTDLCSRLAAWLTSAPGIGRAVAYDASFGLHAVHRLDRETSGLMLLACRKEIFAFFSRQFTADLVEKDYLALVHGRLDHQPEGPWQEWNAALTPQAAGRRDPRGSGHRVECRTRFRVLEHSRHYSLIQCRLVTGRTHQIRRHAALAGHPVLGDRRYGSPRACRFLSDRRGFSRLGLHAWSLKMQMPPEGGKMLELQSECPVALRHLLQTDRSEK